MGFFNIHLILKCPFSVCNVNARIEHSSFDCSSSMSSVSMIKRLDKVLGQLLKIILTSRLASIDNYTTAMKHVQFALSMGPCQNSVREVRLR